MMTIVETQFVKFAINFMSKYYTMTSNLLQDIEEDIENVTGHFHMNFSFVYNVTVA